MITLILLAGCSGCDEKQDTAQQMKPPEQEQNTAETTDEPIPIVKYVPEEEKPDPVEPSDLPKSEDTQESTDTTKKENNDETSD